MLVHILQENLLRALLRTSRIVPTKPQLPVLQNVLISTDEGKIKLPQRTWRPQNRCGWGQIEKEGGLCVSSRLLSDFVSSLPRAPFK